MPDSAASLWAPVERAAAAQQPAPRASFRWVIGALPALVLLTVAALAVFLPEGLATNARLALFAFAAAAILWTLTRLNAAYVSLGAVLFLSLSGAIEQEDLFEALESDVIWLMIGAFVLGAAVHQTGLADRLTRIAAAGDRTVGRVIWLLTLLLLPLAFLIPSTSGRAAVSLPVFRSLSDAAGSRQVTRALALLIPTVILVSTISSLVGAGSHLIANDLLDEVADQRIGFGEWALYGLPFGATASLVSAYVISRMFLSAETRATRLRLPPPAASRFSAAEWRTCVVVLAMVGLWLTERQHGLEIATVSIAGAFLLTLPALGVIKWKTGLDSVGWNLILFVGTALVLGEALIETGAARWLIEQAFAATHIREAGSPLLILLALALISLTSHLYLASHAARAAALIPPLLYLAGALNLDAVAVMFLANVGLNYCLTFPVSSKALLMYQEADGETWLPADLLRLSAVLLPVHALLMAIFYFGYWQHIGLAL